MPTIPEQLMENTDRYVRDCLQILGDRHGEETIRRIVNKMALMMSVEIDKRELELAATDACWTPAEQQLLKEKGVL
jgi:hypothetical protein